MMVKFHFYMSDKLVIVNTDDISCIYQENKGAFSDRTNIIMRNGNKLYVQEKVDDLAKDI